MIEQHNVDEFRDAVESLRGSVCRTPSRMNERVNRLMRRCRRLQSEARGTQMETTVQSLQNMLNRVSTGVDHPEPTARYRQAG